MSRKVFCLLLFLFVFSAISSLVHAENQTVFGPRVFEIGQWHVHFSVHTFDVEDPGEGIIRITKNTPEEQIRGGFVFFNTTLVPLRDFLVGDDLVYEKEITLRSGNYLTVFLRDTPGASITIEVNKAGSPVPPPEVTYSADPQIITTGESSTFTWATAYADSVSIDQGIGSVDLNGSLEVSPTETTTYTLTAVGTGGTTTESVTVTVNIPPPTVTISADPEAIVVGESTSLNWASTNADSASIDNGIGSVDVNDSTTVSPTETIPYTITVTGLGGTATDSVTISVTDPSVPPTVSISATPVTIEQGASSTLTWTSTNAQSAYIDNGIGVVSVEGSAIVSPSHTTTYLLTVTGPTGSASAQAVIMVTGNPEPQPEGSFGEQYEDLIPPDATVEEYDPKRFSVITGLVHTINGSPISEVYITVHSHPEYGTAFTDNEGRFSIPVEGGSIVTVVYQKQGLIPAQREVYVPWNDIAIVETIQMIFEDPKATTFTFDGNPDTVVTHQSTEVTDEFGSRSFTMVFTGDNHAYLVDEDGNDVYELATITTRATEYTTPESMPAKLPPNSAYTYCVELSVDGAQRVRFDKPVITWVDNFLGFDVGEIVPAGYYDRDRGVWVPSDNGVVVRLLDMDNDGIVDALDADGDGQPDILNGGGEGEGGSFSDEVIGLSDPQKYPPDSTIWRVVLAHFSPCDYNNSYGPPTDAISPNPEGEPDADQQKDGRSPCQTSTGSSVDDRSRIFHEDIPIPGTDFKLHYASNRVSGYKYGISIPVSGETVPTSLKRIVVKVLLAGSRIEKVLDPLPNQKVFFIFDGTDYLGRPIRGSAKARVSIGFVYESVYMRPGSLVLRAFAHAGISPTLILTRENVTSWRKSTVTIQVGPKGKGAIAEGWTISAHHQLDPMIFGLLHKGDGTVTGNIPSLIETVAGNGELGYSGDGGPAIDALLQEPTGIAVDAAGNLYIADYWNYCIRKVDTNGVITTVAGNGTSGYNGDGGPATEAQLYRPIGVTVDAAGNLYIAEGGNIEDGNHVIRKVDISGMITTVAGNVTGTKYNDGVLSTETKLFTPRYIAVDAVGNLYIAEEERNVIRKVDPSGIIETVVGNGIPEYSGDGGPAVQAQISKPRGMAVDTDGNLYFADGGNQVIRKVDPSGIITTIAGNGTAGYSGDLGPAVQAQISGPRDVAMDADGNLCFADAGNYVIRKVDSNGIITTIAGTGINGYSGDGGSAILAQLYGVHGVAIDAAGNLYIGDSQNNRIRKVTRSAFASTLTGGQICFTDENGLGYIMSSSRRHKSTIDLDTGVTLYEFGYNEDNQLVATTDQFGNQIIINRDDNGVPTSITSPDGIITSLTIDSNNNLTRVTYPDGNFYDFEYTTDGLITAKIEPEGNRFEHVFDSLGRLTEATDQEGGHWQFSRTAYESGDILTDVFTGEGNLTSYLDHTYSTGAYTATITDPTGAETLFSQSADGLTVNKALPCGMDLEFKYDLDTEYKFKFVKDMRETTPAALEKVTIRDKTYQDTDSDDIPDMITETVAVNDSTTTLENNVLQSQKTITSPEGRTVTTLYDPYNLLTTSLTIPGLHETTFGYNTRGRLTSINTNTRETSFTYNPQGFVESIADPENHTTTYSYDLVGRMTGINLPDGTSIGFTYDGNGNMTVLTNPSAIDHGFGYSAVNLNSSYQTPLSGTYSYVYDKDRRLIQTSFPSGKTINNIYDKTRLVQIQTPEGNIDLSYLCGTKVGSITKGTESITYGYDGSLLTSETLSGTLRQSLSYAYNNDFNVQGFAYAGNTHMYTYDDDGLLTGAGGFIIFRNAGNGLPESVTGGALNLSRTFNGYGEVAGQDFTISGQSLTTWNHTRDDNGRITGKAETVDGTTSNYTYTYDSMGRLLSVTKDGSLIEEYEYDLNGTRTYEMNDLRGISGRAFAYSDEDHLLTAGGTIYEYDLDGFLTTRTFEADVTQYDYSSRGDLMNVTLPDGRVIEYVHDPLGRRVAKKVGGVIVEKYLWHGLTRLLAVYDGSNNLLMRFEYADGRMPVAMTKQGSTYYLTYDQVGSLRIVADASGNVVKLIDYDSFGNIINDSYPTFEVPFGFAAGLHDRDTGLIRFGYRDYDPDIGRWTAKDPILFEGGDTDLYGYCLNDPINWMDPLGLFEASDIGTVAVSVATTTAKVGGLITAGTAITIGAASTVVGVLIPSELADEDRIIAHERTMKEIEELDKRINDAQKWLEPMLDKLNIPYDCDDCDSFDDDPC